MQQATITTRKHRKSRGKRWRGVGGGLENRGGGAVEEENVFLMSKTRSITSGLKSAARD